MPRKSTTLGVMVAGDCLREGAVYRLRGGTRMNAQYLGSYCLRVDQMVVFPVGRLASIVDIRVCADRMKTILFSEEPAGTFVTAYGSDVPF